MLDHGRIVLYSGSYADDAKGLRAEARRSDSLLVVTDSNRKRGRRWVSVTDTQGPTERADETALTVDEADTRLDLFPDAGVSSQTVVVTPDAQVSTTRIGNRSTYWPETRGARALDGNVDTAWEVGDHASVIGEHIRIDTGPRTSDAITTDHVNVVQRLTGAQGRYITRATLTFDGGKPVTVDLDASSRTADGQTIRFPSRRFHRLDIRIDDTNVGDTFEYPVSNAVGFAEIRVRDEVPGATDLRATEIVRMPTDLVDTAAGAAGQRPLVYSMARSRTVVIPPRYSQDEVALVRQFRVPDARSFAMGGTARLATAAADDALDRVLGIADASSGGVTARASQHLPGDVAARASAALDGDATTAWSTAFGAPVGQWLDVQTATPVTLRPPRPASSERRASLGPHPAAHRGGWRVPRRRPSRSRRPDRRECCRLGTGRLRAVDRQRRAGHRHCGASRHDHRIPRERTDHDAGRHRRARSARRAACRAPATLPSNCRTDLVTVDGTARSMRLVGTTADAVAGRPVDLEPCDGAAALGGGDHLLESTSGLDTGIDVDTMVLGSDRSGAPMALGPGGTLGAATTPPSAAAAVPAVRVVDDGRTTQHIDVTGTQRGQPFWLVLGQSYNSGWQASSDAQVVAGSTLVDGYANGWQVTPHTTSFGVTLTWTPQRVIWIALAVSALTMLVCVALVLWRRRRRRDERAARADADAAQDGSVELVNPLVSRGDAFGIRGALVGALVAAAIGSVVARWWIGLVLGALVFLAMLRPRLRAVLSLGAPLCVIAVAAYVVVQQYRYGYPYDYFWVEHFEAISNVAWLAVLLLTADACVELARTRRAGRAGESSSEAVPTYDAPTTSIS